MERIQAQDSGLYAVVSKKRKMDTEEKRDTRHAKRNGKRNYNTRHGRVIRREKLENAGSSNVESSLNSVIRDGWYPMCANGFRFGPFPVAYSNAI